MEIETNGSLPFLDVLVTKKPDSSVGHSVYRKPTHTGLYLLAKSHHHPSQKHAVLTTLINRAKTMCDTERNPTSRKTFSWYNAAAFNRAMNKKQKNYRKKRPVGIVSLPFQQSGSYKSSKLLGKFNINQSTSLLRRDPTYEDQRKTT
jgi:hypothetical protein